MHAGLLIWKPNSQLQWAPQLLQCYCALANCPLTALTGIWQAI